MTVLCIIEFYFIDDVYNLPKQCAVFIYWLMSSKTSFTIALERGVSRVTSIFFRVGNNLSFTKDKRASPVSASPSFYPQPNYAIAIHQG